MCTWKHAGEHTNLGCAHFCGRPPASHFSRYPQKNWLCREAESASRLHAREIICTNSQKSWLHRLQLAVRPKLSLRSHTDVHRGAAEGDSGAKKHKSMQEPAQTLSMHEPTQTLSMQEPTQTLSTQVPTQTLAAQAANGCTYVCRQGGRPTWSLKADACCATLSTKQLQVHAARVGRHECKYPWKKRVLKDSQQHCS
jgi:hypothetical protein